MRVGESGPRRSVKWCQRCTRRYAQGGTCGDYCSRCARELGLVGRYGVPPSATAASTYVALGLVEPVAHVTRRVKYWDPTRHRVVEFEVAWDGT